MTSGYFDPNTRRGHGREGDKDWSFDIAGAPDQRGLDRIEQEQNFSPNDFAWVY